MYRSLIILPQFTVICALEFFSYRTCLVKTSSNCGYYPPLLNATFNDIIYVCSWLWWEYLCQKGLTCYRSGNISYPEGYLPAGRG